jgi:hypothetical protein
MIELYDGISFEPQPIFWQAQKDLSIVLKYYNPPKCATKAPICAVPVILLSFRFREEKKHAEYAREERNCFWRS